MDAYGMISSKNFLGKGFAYTVELYKIKKTNESVANLLRKSKGYSEAYNRYLQLPVELPERVRKLAAEITSSAKNDYDRVKAIEAYIAKNHIYTLEPGSLATDRDFVDYFLFEQKQGYCTYYASAMAVLVRSIGIPARYIEGYVLPSQPIVDTTYEVTNKQAHAWVEVYFEGFGWIPFEPTSPVSQELYDTPEQVISMENSTPDAPDIEQKKQDNDLTVEQEGESEVNNDTGATNISTVSNAKSIGIIACILQLIKLIVWVIFPLVLWFIIFSPIKQKIFLHSMQRLTPQQGVIEMYNHLLRALAVQSLKIKTSETPLQYAYRIDLSNGFKPISFKTVTDIFIKARYSNMSIDEKEMQLVMDFYSTFPEQCKQRIGWLKYFVYNNLLGLI
jgi:hypothetical protein